jgi:periplasmic copper chaperone A
MWKNLIFVLASVCISNAWAGANDPIVSMAWVGESIPGQSNVSLQLNLTTFKAAKLLSVGSPLVESIEIHSLKMHKGKMKLHIVESLSLPAHRTTTFGSNGLFLMMTGVKQQLNIGDRLPLNLKFAFPNNQTKTISAEAEVKHSELSYNHLGPSEIYDHR